MSSTATSSTRLASTEPEQATGPNRDLQVLEKLVGTWAVSGGIEGTISFEWLESGFFLMQRVDLRHSGQTIKGIEIIGYEQKFGEEPGQEIKSRFYSFADGLPLDYVYEVEGDVLTIWGGEKGSPAYMKGTFSPNGNTLSGGWTYPGGGYEMTGTRTA